MKQALPELKLQVVVSDAEQPGKPETSATLAFFEPPWPEEGERIPLIAEEICAVASPRLAEACKRGSPLIVVWQQAALYRITPTGVAAVGCRQVWNPPH
ncbi:type 2 periplasmic-binding domain-containing protein [Sphingopyxis terrae]|uniref:hypothetical protein n=1 Tax=Sphingopyxis terrae TaxID=33052 RepID=UPI00363432CF